MSPIEYKVKARRPAVLSGEQLWLDISFTNVGDAPVPVPGRGDPAPFEFTLTAVTPGGKTYNFSARSKQISLASSPTLPPRVRNARDLAPGKMLIRAEELASYSSEPIDAGTYRLDLTIREGSARRLVASTEIRIQVPNPIALAAQTCLMSRQRLASYVNLEEDGSWALLFRQSRVATPRHDAAVRAFSQPAPAAASTAASTAVSIDIESLAPHPRWFAWIQTEGLFAQNLWGESKPLTLGPLALDGVTSPQLLATGFNLGTRNTFFLVVAGKAGSAVVRRYNLVEGVLALAWEAPCGTTVPQRCLARCQDSKITLVSSGPTDSRLTIRYYSMAGQLVGIRQVIFGRPIETFELEAASSWKDILKAEAPLHVLLQADLQSMMDYRRVALDSGAQMPEIRFLVPAIRPTEFAICANRATGVLAKAGQQILYLNPASNSWKSIADRSAAAGFLQLYTVDGHEYYAEWLDRATGFRLVNVSGH